MADPRIPTVAQRSFVSGARAPEVAPGATRDVSAYARDLDKFFPKHKFLFVTMITFNAPYDTIVGVDKFSLLTQTMTRPKPKFEYGDVNLYGMRTGVLKKTTYDNMSMSFLDDSQNQMMNFYANVLRLQSPLSNSDTSSLLESGQYLYNFGAAEYDEPTNPNEIPANLYSVSSGPLGLPGGGTPPQLIKSIELYHVYRFGRTFNKYTFINPRVATLELDELSMEATDNSILRFTFDYDAFRLDLGVPFEQNPDISNMCGNIEYPIRRDINEESQAAQSSARAKAEALRQSIKNLVIT
jgi:hypothetical protein